MDKQKFNIAVFSGDMDKVLAAFILAKTAASMGMEVSMFFTFWGLNVLRKKKLTSGKNILQKMMNFMNKGGADRLPLSKFNLLGMGPLMMKIMMKQSKVPSIEEFANLTNSSILGTFDCFIMIFIISGPIPSRLNLESGSRSAPPLFMKFIIFCRIFLPLVSF